MLGPGSLFTICRIIGMVLALCAFSLLYAQSGTAPTASGDPAAIDRIWQKASSKYDIERAALLKNVDVADHGGPYRGTRPWRIYGQGPTKVAPGSFHDTETTQYTPADFRFTTKGIVLYAIALAWPMNGEAVVHSLAPTAGSEKVQSVALLGNDVRLQFTQQADGLHVELPVQSPSKYAYAFRVTFAHSR